MYTWCISSRDPLHKLKYYRHAKMHYLSIYTHSSKRKFPDMNNLLTRKTKRILFTSPAVPKHIQWRTKDKRQFLSILLLSTHPP